MRARVDANKLFHAIMVAREGSFAAAAALIPISQSALTRSIQSLESQYKLRIFERGRTGTRLTTDGVAFISAAEDIMWSVDRAEERLVAVSSGHSATVRFGAGPVMNAGILPDVVARLARLSVRLEILIGSNAALRSLLSRGEIDFFLGGALQGSDHFTKGYGFQISSAWPATGAIRIVVRSGHPLTQGPLTPERLSRFPVACESFKKEQLGPGGFEALGLQRPSVEIDDYQVLASLACGSDYIVVANWAVDTLRSRGALITRMLIARYPREWNWVFVSSNRTPLSPAASAVQDMLREAVSEFVDNQMRAGAS